MISLLSERNLQEIRWRDLVLATMVFGGWNSAVS
jgi:hypothetical protein